MNNDERSADAVRDAAARRPVPPAAGDGRALQQQRTETTDDIVRGMRALGALDAQCDDMIPRSLMALGLRTYADRLEAAAQRQREAAEARQLNECVVVREEEASEWRKRIGNAAAVRAAFKGLLSALEVVGFQPLVEGDPLAEAVLKARDALDAPARNCDSFATADEARRAFEEAHSRAIINIYMAAFDWLFATAEGVAE